MLPLTYATALAYLLSLGQRFTSIGTAELTFTGEASGTQPYPLLLVEADAPGNSANPGLDNFTVAIQVLNQQASPDEAGLLDMLVQTNRWADELTEQMHYERPGQLVNVNKLPLPGTVGSDLATGWRLELSLKITKEVNRTTNRALFAPLS